MIGTTPPGPANPGLFMIICLISPFSYIFLEQTLYKTTSKDFCPASRRTVPWREHAAWTFSGAGPAPTVLAGGTVDTTFTGVPCPRFLFFLTVTRCLLDIGLV